jgi:hypothetical protein
MIPYTLLFSAMLAVQAPPAQVCTINGGGGVADGGRPVAFETVADTAVAIVEATVQSKIQDPPTTGPGTPIPRNRVLLRATRVIKGSDQIKDFTIAPIVAVGLFNMEPGERVILFLNSDPRSPAYPGRPEVQAYTLAVGGGAALCIDAGGKIRLNGTGGFLRSKFDGADLEKAVADIRAHVNRR